MHVTFTERARKAVFYAQEEAEQLGENYVGTEHLLLGLVREEDTVACRILAQIGVPPGKVKSEVIGRVPRGRGTVGQEMQLSDRSKRAIDLAYEEARALNNQYLGTEHLLLGLIREGDGLAARILAGLGADADKVRREVEGLQSS